MANHERKHALLGLLFTLVAIAVGVAAVVYGVAVHRRHLDAEKWRDYDECGL